MLQRVSNIQSNASAQNMDYDVSILWNRLIGSKGGVLFSSASKDEFIFDKDAGIISAGSDIANAVILCTRVTSNPIPYQKFLANFQFTGDLSGLQTTNGTVVYIEINNELINDPSLIEDLDGESNFAKGYNIGEIKSGDSFPTHDNYIPLRWIDESGTLIDLRDGIEIPYVDDINEEINNDLDTINGQINSINSSISSINTAISNINTSLTYATDEIPGVVEKATDEEVLVGTDETRYINSKQLEENILYKGEIRCVASETLQVSADTERNTTAQDWSQLKSITVGHKGNIRIKIDGNADSNQYAGIRLYKNGTTIMTIDDDDLIEAWTTYTKDIEVEIGDIITVSAEEGAIGSSYVYVKNFRIYYDLYYLQDSVIQD